MKNTATAAIQARHDTIRDRIGQSGVTKAAASGLLAVAKGWIYDP